MFGMPERLHTRSNRAPTILTMAEDLDPHLIQLGAQPRYSVAEAARLSRLKPQTLQRWAAGYDYEGGSQPAVIRKASPADGLSFFDLLEAAFVRSYRERGLSLQSIRRALD